MMHVRSTMTALAVCLLIGGSAAADIEIHQEHTFAAHVGATVIVDVSFHGVEVTARPGDTVRVAVDVTVRGDGSSAKNAIDALQPEFIDEGDRIIIRSTRKKGFSWRSISARGTVTVQMPPDMDLTVNSSSGSAKINGDFGLSVVRFDASSGSLTLDGSIGALLCDTSSGSVRAAVSEPLEVFVADASSGSIRFSGGAHEAKVDTSSGSIDVSGLVGEGKFSTSSGSIKAQWDAIPPDTKVRAGTSSGSVTLRFPPGTAFLGTVDVSSGGLHTDFPALVRGKKKLEFDGGPDAVDIEVSTSSGSVRLLSN